MRHEECCFGHRLLAVQELVGHHMGNGWVLQNCDWRDRVQLGGWPDLAGTTTSAPSRSRPVVPHVRGCGCGVPIALRGHRALCITYVTQRKARPRRSSMVRARSRLLALSFGSFREYAIYMLECGQNMAARKRRNRITDQRGAHPRSALADLVSDIPPMTLPLFFLI